MEAAQAAIARHTSRRGHFTDVEETVRPAITSETIKPHRHEITTEAYDREVHQHHYHTTVQPLSHTETLPTRHTHNLLPVKKTTHEHEDAEENRRRLAEFAALFRDISITHATTYSTEAHAPVIGEHVHHHVHETVQPIIYKETIQRETVHTTVPVHEIHRNKARHHGLSAMPAKTMEEFLAFNAGRKVGEIRHSHHEGAPREYDSKLATTFEKLGIVSPVAAKTATPTSGSRTLPNINTTTSPTTTTTTTSAIRNPVTPTRKPFHKHHDATNQGLTSPNSRGSFSSDSSVSSSDVPSTPNSPNYRNNMLPKNNVMNTMPLNKEVVGPTTTTNTITPNTHVNTQTNTMSNVNTIPTKNTNATEPVRIARNSGEGDLSPRYSSDEATTGARRGFLGRLSGSHRRSNKAY